MTSIRRHLTWLSALALALVLALPAAAQRGTDPGQPVQPAPNPRTTDVVRCERLGLALAVVSQDGTIADIIAAADAAGTTRPGATLARPVTRTILIDAPTKVGICADFSGYWGPGAAGTERVVLSLLAVNPPSTTNTPAASDSLDETKTGPATSQRSLKAALLIDKAGTYAFTGRLTVEAGATGGQAVRDAFQVPVVVEYREKPKSGAIEGTVLDADGRPIEGARVHYSSLGTSNPGRPRVVLPVEPPVLLGVDSADASVTDANAALLAADQDQGGRAAKDPTTALTDKDGKYHLDAPAGRYVVNAEAKGFKTQWYNGKDNAREADPVDVTAGNTTAGIDFHLAAGSTAPRATAAPRPTQAPRETGSIRGRVTSSQGVALEGIVVSAVMSATLGIPGAPRPLGSDVVAADQDPRTPGQSSNAGFVARTNADGMYELKVPVGKWLVAARADVGYAPQWYDGKATAKEATPVEVAKDAATENINFALTKLPSATVSGIVSKDGAPLKGVTVSAVQRGADGKAIRSSNAAGLAGYRLSAATLEDGSYSLILPPAANWAVSATMRATSSRAGGATLWFDAKQTLEEADLLDLADGATRSGVSFAFAP